MSELRELYQEYVLDHGKNPRNFRYPEGATHTAGRKRATHVSCSPSPVARVTPPERRLRWK